MNIIFNLLLDLASRNCRHHSIVHMKHLETFRRVSPVCQTDRQTDRQTEWSSAIASFNDAF